MRLLLLILGLSVALQAQTVTVKHYSPYSRTGLGMNVALTGESSTDILTITLNGTEVFRQIGNIRSSQSVRFSYGGRTPGNYTMVTSLLNSGGTLKASATETLPIKATGSVTIDEYDNIFVNGKPKFMLNLWMDTLQRFQQWNSMGALTGYGWVELCVGGNCEGPYSASEWNNTLSTSLYPYSPYGVIGPSGNDFTSGGRFKGTVPDYVSYRNAATNKYSSDMMLYWYWQDEPDINLGPTWDGNCSAGNEGTASTGDGCSKLRYLYYATHNNDPDQRPIIEDFYGYFMSYSIQGKGYTNPWPAAVADIHGYDNYLYEQLQGRAPTPVAADGYISNTNNTPRCTVAVSADISNCALTVAQYVDLFEYFKSLFHGLTPVNPIIEGGGMADGATPICYTRQDGNGHTLIHHCPGPNGDQFRMEAYLMIIHGAKGLTYWTSWAGGPGAPIRSDVVHEMVNLESNMKVGMETAILSTPTRRTITSNQTTAGSRVDAMVAETRNTVWVVAQRLTDDIANPAEAGASPLSTELTVSGLTGTAIVPVMNESRTVNMVNGVITDNFAPYATHIYALPRTPKKGIATHSSFNGNSIASMKPGKPH